MSVIQIALGVVLGLLIWRFLPAILALGTVLVLGSVVLLLAVFAFLFLSERPEKFLPILIVVALGIGFYWLVSFIHSKRPHLVREEIFAALIAIALWVGSLDLVLLFDNLYAIAIFVAIGIGGAYYFIRWDKREQKRWLEEKQKPVSLGQVQPPQGGETTRLLDR